MNQEKATQPREFTGQFNATRRGARYARVLAVEQLRAWGLPLDDMGLVIAELTSNAVLRGHVPGRDFRLVMAVTRATVRVEVTDACGERLPAAVPEPGTSESGRGLLLVEALADRWGVIPGPPPCKTVWSEFDLGR